MAHSAQLERSAYDTLASSPVFTHVSPARLRDIANHSRRRTVAAGEVLMHQGATSDSMDVLVHGHVKIERLFPDGDKPALLAHLGPGDVVGEMGVLAGSPRSATVTALDEVETLELRAGFLKKLFRSDTDVLVAIMRIISQRWQSMDEVVEINLQVALTQLVAQGDR